MEVKRRSAWWFLLPILFNVVGGVIAYFVIKEDTQGGQKTVYTWELFLPQ